MFDEYIGNQKTILEGRQEWAQKSALNSETKPQHSITSRMQSVFLPTGTNHFTQRSRCQNAVRREMLETDFSRNLRERLADVNSTTYHFGTANSLSNGYNLMEHESKNISLALLFS